MEPVVRLEMICHTVTPREFSTLVEFVATYESAAPRGVASGVAGQSSLIKMIIDNPRLPGVPDFKSGKAYLVGMRQL